MTAHWGVCDGVWQITEDGETVFEIRSAEQAYAAAYACLEAGAGMSIVFEDGDSFDTPDDDWTNMQMVRDILHYALRFRPVN